MAAKGDGATDDRGLPRRLLRVIGWLIVAASLVFLGQRIWVSQLWTLEDVAIGPAAGMVICGAIAYGINCLLLSTAWCAWLRWTGENGVTLRVCHGVYGRTQIAKYLPGNVFHFASRHVVGRKAGFSHKPMVAAAVMEVLTLVSAAGVLAVGGLGWHGLQRAAAGVHPALAAAGVVVLIALPLVVAMAAGRLPGPMRIERLEHDSLWKRVQPLLLPYACTVLFMAIAGGLFVAVTQFGIVTIEIAPAPLVVGVFAFAWLAGFVVPGASGGLGVREAAMVVPLAPFIGEPQAIVAALLMRMVTIGGDLVYFGLAQLYPAGSRGASDASVAGGMK